MRYINNKITGDKVVVGDTSLNGIELDGLIKTTKTPFIYKVSDSDATPDVAVSTPSNVVTIGDYTITSISYLGLLYWPEITYNSDDTISIYFNRSVFEDPASNYAGIRVARTDGIEMTPYLGLSSDASNGVFVQSNSGATEITTFPTTVSFNYSKYLEILGPTNVAPYTVTIDSLRDDNSKVEFNINNIELNGGLAPTQFVGENVLFKDGTTDERIRMDSYYGDIWATNDFLANSYKPINIGGASYDATGPYGGVNVFGDLTGDAWTINPDGTNSGLDLSGAIDLSQPLVITNTTDVNVNGSQGGALQVSGGGWFGKDVHVAGGDIRMANDAYIKSELYLGNNILSIGDDISTFLYQSSNNTIWCQNNIGGIITTNTLGDFSVGANLNVGGGEIVVEDVQDNGKIRLGSSTDTYVYGNFSGDLILKSAINRKVYSLKTFNITGDLEYSGSLIPTSTRKLKENIVDLDDDVYKILKIQPREYNRKSDGVKDVGVIAEELVDIGLDKLVYKDEEGECKGVDYIKMPLYLIPIIKQQQTKISYLELKIQDIENKINQLT